MNNEEKLLWMFKQVHGEMTGSYSAEVLYDVAGEAYSVACMKYGNLCWEATKLDLIFDFLTKDL